MVTEDTTYQQRLDEVGKILTSGDADRIANLYTKDGQVMPPGSDTVTGQEAVAEFWQDVRNTGVETIEIETIEAENDGNTASRVGRAMLSDANGEMVDDVKFIEIWKQDDGEWQIYRDIWNSNLPAEQ